MQGANGDPSFPGLVTASSGAACRAGLALLPILPRRRLSIASMTQAETSLSAVKGRWSCPGPRLSPSVPHVSSSSSSSEIVGGFINGASQGCLINMAYVGRCLGTLCRHERTKSRAASEKPLSGRSGGSPSTIACCRSCQPSNPSLLKRKTYAQLAENIVIGLRRIRVSTHGTFDDGQAQTPNVTLNTICSTTRIGPGLSNSSA